MNLARTVHASLIIVLIHENGRKDLRQGGGATMHGSKIPNERKLRMRAHVWIAAAFAFIGNLPSALALETRTQDAVRAVDGEWNYVEDRTLEQLSAPVASELLAAR